MPTFDWDDSFLVGVLRIDKHNHHLFELFKKLIGTINDQSDREKIVFEFEELFDYIVFHFACEEIWMKYTSYCSISQHQQEHNLLTQVFTETYNCFLKRDDSVLQGLQFLCKSIIAHIQNYDVKYGNYVNDNLSVKSIPRRHQK